MKYEFYFHSKPALTNVRIKPHSCIPSGTIANIFKGFLVRTTKTCSKNYLRAEIEYMTDMFCGNGYDWKTIQKIINNFGKKTNRINNNSNNKTDKKQALTFPWIQNTWPKIKKEIQKFRFRIGFQTGLNLKNILCKSKYKLIRNSHPGMSKLKCQCGSENPCPYLPLKF